MRVMNSSVNNCCPSESKFHGNKGVIIALSQLTRMQNNEEKKKGTKKKKREREMGLIKHYGKYSKYSFIMHTPLFSLVV